jgi:hypothetical protein
VTTAAEAKAALDARLARSREAIAEQAAAQGWTVSYQIKIHGRDVSLGTELSSPGRGRLRFVAHVRTAAGVEWINCLGPTGFCSVRPDRVATVHRINKTREASVA